MRLWADGRFDGSNLPVSRASGPATGGLVRKKKDAELNSPTPPFVAEKEAPHPIDPGWKSVKASINFCKKFFGPGRSRQKKSRDSS